MFVMICYDVPAKRTEVYKSSSKNISFTNRDRYLWGTSQNPSI